MSEQRVQELEMKVAFLERHLEEMDRELAEVNTQLRSMKDMLERLAAQKNQGPGGDESAADAVPPHY